MATKRVAAKAKPVARRATAQQRQRALELAVSVSGIGYSFGNSGGMSSYAPDGVKRRNYEDTPTILKAAADFLAFLSA